MLLSRREHKRAAAERAPVLVGGEGPEARPDVPPVDATVEPVSVPLVQPRARDPEVVRPGPGAEDLLAADELDVVVLGALGRRPAEHRGSRNTLSRHRREEGAGSRDGDRLGGAVARLVDRLDGVVV